MRKFMTYYKEVMEATNNENSIETNFWQWNWCTQRFY